MHAHLLDRIGDPGRRGRALRLLLVLAPLVALGAVSSHLMAPARAAADPCSPLVNAIACENSKAGTDQSIWDVNGAGDANIQGFATDISAAPGDTVHFKINTPATSYRIDIYRLGYYGGLGARKWATLAPTAQLPQSQPACLTDASTGLVDCGNWHESASWPVPTNAVSGVYIAHLTRTDGTSGESLIPFIVRDDASHSDILFQTSDATWQAYNRYGGNSFYTGGPGTWPGRAYKVSYNRPLTTRDYAPEDFVFNAEYPMIRFLEANGYDVSYTTDLDVDRHGSTLLDHKTFLSAGHDEYVSGGQRANIEAARAAGVNLAFFSGNSTFWKTRWEPSIDGSGTAYRTLVTYKETAANAKIDPSPQWTGSWRDPRFSPPSDGGRPENALQGTIFMVACDPYSITVPAAYAKLRIWRNTSIANLQPGQLATFPLGTLGYEWDEDLDNGSRPAGLIDLSATKIQSLPDGCLLTDYGSAYGPGSATHSLTLYRAPSGALVFGAGTVQWSWGLDGVHDRTQNVPTDVRMQQATVNLLADMHAQPGTLQSGLVPATASTDTTPPTSTVSAPAPGEQVPVGRAYTITGTASDAGGGVVGGVEVSVDGGATWHPATGTASWSYSWSPTAAGSTTIKVRATDDSGNIETPGAGVTVTTVRICPCTIWPASATPGTQQASDPNPVELGVKFKSDLDGYVTGVRFFKGSANTGTHVGDLWTSGGTLLATGTFASETASGWQQLDFSSPVPITAGTTYVASYHTNTGNYAFDGGFFSNAGVDAAPLYALKDGVSGANGVYKYGASPTFPTDSYQASNYWVDVVFTQNAVDTTPPTVQAIAPARDSTGISALAAVKATFTEPVQPATISFTLTDSGGVPVPAAVSYDRSTLSATLTPLGPLSYSTMYTASVSGAKDLAGNALSPATTWQFTTAGPPPPPPDQGPGGPILVITSASNRFTTYYAEILRNEGLNEFATSDISSVTSASLANYDVAILGDMALTQGQVSMLSAWVQGGGNLIAMRPDKQLAGLLGLTDQGTTQQNGYLQVDTSAAPGAGIVGQTIQYHGAADNYTLNGASAVATLYSSATSSTPNPAVTLRTVGVGSGQAAAFTYDLARSIVLTRQGNPAWAGQERDGSAPIRPDDLFYGPATGDPQPDWVDLSKVAIPQADEQQRLLANLIELMNRSHKPLPRFWYLPRGAKAAIVLSGDDHGGGGTAGRFDYYVSRSPANCVVANWQCIRATSYVYAGAPLTDAQAVGYVKQGFEVSMHPTTGCLDFTPASLDTTLSTTLAAWTAQFPDLPAPATNRMHCVVWSDWASLPKLELQYGIRLDSTYYYWPPGWVNDRPGFFTGSGMPMRFADSDGTMLDVYQAPTQMTDESGQTYPLTVNTLLDNATGPLGYYGVFAANMHNDTVQSDGAAAIIDSALAHGVPVVSAKQMLDWLDGRNGSSFKSVTWNTDTLSFSVSIGTGASGLQVMLPTTSSAGTLNSITLSGSPVTFTRQTIKGIEYAVFTAAAGTFQARYAAQDTTPPVISNVVATPTTSGATITWTTDEPSSSRVDYGTNSGALTSNVSDPTATTAHSLVLTGLAAGTTYSYRVTSTDGSGNAATSPAPPAAAATFSTGSLSATQTTSADFATGTRTSTYVSATADGEVILQPTVGTEFSGTTLPSGWSSALQTGGSSAVGGGLLTEDGAGISYNTRYAAGRSLEFVATFSGQANQQIGFGATLTGAPWATFSTGTAGGGLYARTSNGTTSSLTPISGSWLGSPHRFRIDWSTTGVVYSIDGTTVSTVNTAIATTMRPLVRDTTTGGGSVSVDWMRMTPYPATGTFTSSVIDSGRQAAWNTATWSSTTPSGTALAVSVRTGNTATPDATWSAFSPLATSGAQVGATARYLQYRVTLTSTAPTATAALQSITFSYGG